MENKEENLKPLDEDELENVIGGTQGLQCGTGTLIYQCTKCSWSGEEASLCCPQCGSVIRKAYDPVHDQEMIIIPDRNNKPQHVSL